MFVVVESIQAPASSPFSDLGVALQCEFLIMSRLAIFFSTCSGS